MLLSCKIINTTLTNLEEVVKWYEKLIEGLGVEENAVFVFNELLLNSYEHGNLAISKSEKNELLKKGIYKKKLLALEKNCNKKIFIEIHLFENYILTKITDEGEGFDLKKIDKEKMEYCGRGILLSKKFTNLYYNDRGNSVSFIFNIKGEGMDLKISSNVIKIYGNVKSIEDTEKIIQAVESIKDSDTIVLEFVDSISITSSLIGYLMQLINEKKLILRVASKILYDILKDLNLVEKFNVMLKA